MFRVMGDQLASYRSILLGTHKHCFIGPPRSGESTRIGRSTSKLQSCTPEYYRGRYSTVGPHRLSFFRMVHLYETDQHIPDPAYPILLTTFSSTVNLLAL